MKNLFNRLKRNKIIARIIENWRYRTVFSAGVGFVMVAFNSIVNGVLGIKLKSIWFGALAAYYILLALMRCGLFLHFRRRDERPTNLVKARIYKRCGILLLILNAALSSAIAQMIFDDRGFEYKDWLIYGFAAYAFYKITMSIINVLRAARQEDLTIRAVREINLIDSAVSILALQTALLHTFSDATVDISLFNTLTGSAVSLFSITLSIMMIVRGNKKIKEIKNGKQ